MQMRDSRERPPAYGVGWRRSARAWQDGNAFDGDASGLFTTVGNVPITLWTDPVNNNIVYGKANGTTVFAAYLEETGTPLSGAKMDGAIRGDQGPHHQSR
ncbi:hypothetical protein [Pseudoduganella chitinolytica]|uniref:Uncharacterized protein n=1 Tax=Pseudoduganella chitinolytica TaxID=34070 RepID=A0ABY8BL02_9BURK|nr:hypothetical protein [Pseudoduganella chitinolytica]WEF35586.1 hypothetical protein PX653_12795 [Pseudoduganella chitinolytica]